MGKRPCKAAAHGDGDTPSKKHRMLTSKSIAAQKLRENLSTLTDTEIWVITNKEDGLTCRQRVEKDVADRLHTQSGSSVITFGKWYYDDLRAIYRDEKSVYALIKPFEVHEGAHDAGLESVLLGITQLIPPPSLVLLSPCPLVP